MEQGEIGNPPEVKIFLNTSCYRPPFYPSKMSKVIFLRIGRDYFT